MSVLSALVAVVALAGALSPPQERTQNIKEPLAYGARLTVQNGNGGIRVTGWDREEVSLTAQIRESGEKTIKLIVKRVGRDLAIEARFQQPAQTMSLTDSPDWRCELTLSVPRKLAGEFRSLNGNVRAASLEGSTSCATTNGDLTVRDLAGPASLQTCNGSIDAQGLRGRVRGGTSNGKVVLEDLAGGVDLKVGNGSIRARDLDGAGDDLRLEVGNGPIDLRLGKASGTLDASNKNGSIEVQLPGGEPLASDPHHVRLRLPGGSQRITLVTVNGDILVR